LPQTEASWKRSREGGSLWEEEATTAPRPEDSSSVDAGRRKRSEFPCPTKTGKELTHSRRVWRNSPLGKIRSRRPLPKAASPVTRRGDGKGGGGSQKAEKQAKQSCKRTVKTTRRRDGVLQRGDSKSRRRVTLPKFPVGGKKSLSRLFLSQHD